MTFISSVYEKYKSRITVWEKVDGQRVVRHYKPPLYFYVPDPNGEFLSLKDEPLKKLTFSSLDDFDRECLSRNVKFESDLSPLEKVMMDNYAGQPTPELTVGLLDIEVDSDPALGWATTENPYAPINALTLCKKDKSGTQYITVAVPPPNCTDLLDDLAAENYFVVNNERELLELFFTLIEDVDLLSGWNSDFFDIPYIGKRVELLFGERGLARLGFTNAPPPRWTERERFKGSKEKEITLDLVSRVHLDYMRIFKKFNLEGRQSYSLAAIADEELDIPKLHYEGTLHDLYRKDFRHFCLYNRRDVEIIDQLDQKFNYIGIANQMVHEATVNFSAVFGSVQLIDTAIINIAHLDKKRIVHDKQHRPKDEVEGALVLTPAVGMHEWIASVDINSLYPNIYRSLNLSPEKIVGQLMEYEEGWKRIHLAVRQPNNDLLMTAPLTLRLEGEHPDNDLKLTVADMIELLMTKRFAVSGYGTILDQSSGEGLIPYVLSYWFKGRKELQAKKKAHAKRADELLAQGRPKDDPEYLEELRLSAYYDMLQGVRKVLLNSSYGATLNEFCRFHDPRLGASTTGSGRQVTTFMINTVAEVLGGDQAQKIVKEVKVNKKGEVENVYTIAIPPGAGPLYSDTDSCYFTMSKLVNDVESAVGCANAVADHLNSSFVGFMQEAFFCQPEFDSCIKVAREIVASAGIFRAKKKYIMLAADIEGKRMSPEDPKALKTAGSDIKITSVPVVIRQMLRDVTLAVLRGTPKAKVDDMIMEFRRNLKDNPDTNPLDFASVSSVKTYDEAYMKWNAMERHGKGRVTMTANIRSAINHNYFLELANITTTQPIIGGSKIKMVWLKPNEYGFTTMGFSSDLDVLPDWFKENFEVDLKLTEKKLIDQKIGNIFEPIGWEVPTEKTVQVGRLLSF